MPESQLLADALRRRRLYNTLIVQGDDQGMAGCMKAQTQVETQIFEEFVELVSSRSLEQVARLALESQGANGSGRLGLVVADDDTVRELNLRHRGLDETTDVLSFSPSHEGKYYGVDDSEDRNGDGVEFVLPPGDELGLGEVVISYPQAQRQAETAGHGLDRELTVLLVHGILHLLGHDHEVASDAKAMKVAEAEALTHLGGAAPQ